MASIVIIDEISHYGEVEKTWANDNCPSFFMCWLGEFHFKNELDAILFNLKFGGKLSNKNFFIVTL